MRLGSKIVYFIRLNLSYYADEVRRICHIPIIKERVLPGRVFIGMKMFDALPIACACPAHNPVNVITFVQQALRKI